ncbi:Crp/Fnr family transcriptional regulator [Methylobacterium flocculans]|jgi:CRP-like cAMP-binding protein|uniref:Crp/Fnr family transcriptional regulator n=1 Tax=Methylobacterium flocculans TaxID=2984843 RepID=UPI0021F38AFD|nr:Crp/Fnr family transcriptional regulator [Methylobacterium sp. FF17]
MPQVRQAAVRNRLLKALCEDDFALLQPHLQPLRTTMRQTLIHPHEPVTHLLFPEIGYASVVADVAGNRIEVGIIGREGLVGASPVLLDGGTAPYHEFVQSPGEMLAIGTADFRAAVDRSPTFRTQMLRYLQTVLIQARQTAYANAAYTMDVRLARWLLICQDRLDGDIPVTHDFLAVMLGVQRSGATLAVQSLEGSRLIKARRGCITVLNREALVELANGSYGVSEAEYARLIEGV